MATKTLMTADELLGLYPHVHGELWYGELRETMPTGGPHGYVVINGGTMLKIFVREHKLGVVNGGELGYLLQQDPDLLHAPDISFVSRARLQEIGIPERGYWPLAPDLAVEVLSPSETAVDVALKVDAYLAAGTRLVWVVSPPTQSVTVYYAGGEVRLLRTGDFLEGGDVLPGFHAPVADLFEQDL